MSQTNGTQMTDKLKDKSVSIDEDETAQKSVSAVDYGVEDVPPWPTAIFLGLQVPYFFFWQSFKGLVINYVTHSSIL